MTPELLQSSYKQYKADSDAVATWLANTGRKCGYPIDLFSQQTPAQKQPKLKGRARKLARDAERKHAADKSKNSSSTGSSQRYVLAIREFVPLAEWILKATKPIIDVPADIINILDKTIAARRQHKMWWAGKKDGPDNTDDLQKVNESHSHFIEVLEQVRDTLRLRMLPKSGKISTEAPKDALLSVTNRFGILEVSQSFSPSEASEPESKQRSLPIQPIRFTVEQEPDVGEVQFALGCFFQDMYDIRRYLQKVWEGYKHNVFDLVSASLVTNTASQFVQGIEEDFAQTFPDHADFQWHVQVLKNRACVYVSYDSLYRDLEHDEMNFEVYDELEKLLYPTHLMLRALAMDLDPGTIPVFESSLCGDYDPKSDRASKSGRDKFYEDRSLLYGAMPDLCLLAARTEAISNLIPVEDEIVQGIRVMTSRKSPPIWLTFAAQVFLDVNHILRDNVGRGLEDLRKSSKPIANSITDFLKFHEQLRSRDASKLRAEYLTRILEIIKECIDSDSIEQGRKNMLCAADLPPLEPFFLLRHHPWLCGLLCFVIKSQMQDISISAANAWGGILYTAHLYNALRQEKMLSKNWKDMDLALVMHRFEDIFVGSFPTTIDDYFKRFVLALGFSATNFAPGRETKSAAILSKVGPRSLNRLTPASRMFMPRLIHNCGLPKFSPEHVDTILKKHAEEGYTRAIGVDKDGNWTTPGIEVKLSTVPGMGDERKDAMTKLYKRQKKMKCNSTMIAGVRPIELLNVLLDVLQSENIDLSFDHLQLHLTCCRILQAVHEELNEDLQRHFGVQYLIREDRLASVVGYTFMTVTKSNGLGHTLTSEQRVALTRTFLIRAAKVVESMMERGDGEVACRSLEELLGVGIDVQDVIKDRSG